jgi:hypothetical protein
MMQSRYDAHFGSTNLGYKLRFQVVNIYTVCMMDLYEHLSLKKIELYFLCELCYGDWVVLPSATKYYHSD